MQVRGEKDYTSLAKGLITERSPLLGEEQACISEQNFVFDTETLARVRRKGLNQVSSYNTSQFLRLARRHHWEEAGLFVDMLINTSGAGGRIQFLNDTAPYAQRADFQFGLSASSDPIKSSISSNSSLCLVAFGGSIFAVQRTSTHLRVHTVNIHVRDFKLIDDGLRVTERPSPTLSLEHQYNLLNAGWYAQRRGSNGQLADPIALFSNEGGDFPSNADIAQLGLKTNEQGQEIFTKATLVDTIVGSTQAPRGHYVYNITAFNRVFATSNPQNDGVPSTTALFATEMPL